MAKILDQEEQRKALKNINGSIKDLEAANEFLKAQNPSGVYTISFTGEGDKKYSTVMHAENKEELNLLILAHKEREKERIKALAEENRIALDPEDEVILDYTL